MGQKKKKKNFQESYNRKSGFKKDEKKLRKGSKIGMLETRISIRLSEKSGD